MSATTVSAGGRAALLPLFVAPLAAGLYYLAVRAAFSLSIETASDTIRAAKSELAGLAGPEWGTHWFYRLGAELVSVWVATFVAGGLARGREQAAAIIGGAAIALGYLVWIAFLLVSWTHAEAITEAWYHCVIDGLLVIAAPCIGFYGADAARDANAARMTGFGGINRLHFLWLWVAAFWYALGLISPIFHFYELQFGYVVGHNPFAELTIIMTLAIVDVVPVSVLLVPGFYGLGVLAGQRGSSLHPMARNLLGIIVLVAGFVAATYIQIGWQNLLQQLLD